MQSPLLVRPSSPERNSRTSVRNKVIVAATTITVGVFLICCYAYAVGGSWGGSPSGRASGLQYSSKQDVIVESEVGVVAADDGRCSEVGVAVLKDGGHAVDAAVATAICLGVVHPMSSGIGGGGFMVLRSAQTGGAQAYDFRETAPLAASQDMYESNPAAKSNGGLSMGVPGEVAGLYEAWLQHGRLPWRTLFEPSISLARDGFLVTAYIESGLQHSEKAIMADPGLRRIFAPAGKLLKEGDTCYNRELARTLQALAEQGPSAFYNGSIGESFVKDVQNAGGILTMEDLRQYKVEVEDAMKVDVMGYSVLGMPLPSSGTVGLALVMNILESFGTPDAAKGALGLHRLVEALKHMLAIRMNLGDPHFVNAAEYVADMLSPSYAKEIRQRILDNTTYPSSYYLSKWSQLRDHGTSHFCIVDADRNALSLTTTVNYYFGAGVLSPSTGIVLNNEMDDFSTPTESTIDKLPPAPSNFIQPNKRPLSSMTPIIVLKDNQVAGVIGGSGGLYIIPAVIQVFLNHFVLGMDPLDAVRHPRVYHKLVPNVVLYENWTMIDGDHIELAEEMKLFLKQRSHVLRAQANGAVCQLVVQDLDSVNVGGTHRKGLGNEILRGLLTAVSDPRKDGRPAGI